MARNKPANFETQVQMGLGEALLRLIRVDQESSIGLGDRETLLSERELIIEALNQQYQLNLGFDCNMDGVPDTVEIFMQSAKTSCCRILPTKSKNTPSLEDDLAARGGGITPKKAKAAPKKAAPKKAAPKKTLVKKSASPKASSESPEAKTVVAKPKASKKTSTPTAKKTSRSRGSRSRKK